MSKDKRVIMEKVNAIGLHQLRNRTNHVAVRALGVTENEGTA